MNWLKNAYLMSGLNFWLNHRNVREDIFILQLQKNYHSLMQFAIKLTQNQTSL